MINNYFLCFLYYNTNKMSAELIEMLNDTSVEEVMELRQWFLDIINDFTVKKVYDNIDNSCHTQHYYITNKRNATDMVYELKQCVFSDFYVPNLKKREIISTIIKRIYLFFVKYKDNSKTMYNTFNTNPYMDYDDFVKNSYKFMRIIQLLPNKNMEETITELYNASFTACK